MHSIKIEWKLPLHLIVAKMIRFGLTILLASGSEEHDVLPLRSDQEGLLPGQHIRCTEPAIKSLIMI